MKAKKRLLYIDLNNETNNFRNQMLTAMYAEFFREHYDTDVFWQGPCVEAVELIRKAKDANGMYDLIVTNVPMFKRRCREQKFRRFAFLNGVNYEYYDYSMSILAGIKQLHDVPILAFTGASFDDRLSFIQTGFVDEAVEGDQFPVFRKQIDRLIASYGKLPPPPKTAARIEETETGLRAQVQMRLNNPIPCSVSSIFEKQCDYEQFGLQILGKDGQAQAAERPEPVQHGFHLRWKCRTGDMVVVQVNGKSDLHRKFIADVCETLACRYVFEAPWIMDLEDHPRERVCDYVEFLFVSERPDKNHRRLATWKPFERCLAKIGDESLRAKWLKFRSIFKEGDELWRFEGQDCNIFQYICQLPNVHLQVVQEAVKAKKLPSSFGPGFCRVYKGHICDYVDERPISADLLGELQELTRLRYPNPASIPVRG